MLKKIKSFFDKFYDKVPFLINLIYDLAAITVSFELGFYFKVAYGICVFISLELLHILKIPQFVFKNFNLVAVLLPAIGMFQPLYKLFRYQQEIVSVIPFKSVKFLAMANYLICVWVIAGIICAKYNKDGIKRAVRSLLSAGGLLFVFFIFLPSDTFIGNAEEFEMTYNMFIGNFLHAYAVYALPAVLLLMCIKGDVFDYIADILSGITLAVFVQYQFLNNHLPLLGTAESDFAENIGLVVGNMLIWILLIFLPMSLRKISKEKLGRLSTILGACPIAFFIVAYVLTLVSAPTYAYHIMNEYFFDPADQYTLSSERNVSVFLLDAYDQQYLYTLLDEQPELFDDLKDFTMYTDAVSLYDSTTTSMSQMFGGCTFDNTLNIHDWMDNGWNSESTVSFYEALHNNGYTVNSYNFPAPYPEYLLGKFDNLCQYDEPVELEPSEFNYKEFAESMRTLSMYRAFPYVVKQFINIGKYDFKNFVEYEDLPDAMYMNEDYEANLSSLSLTNNSGIFTLSHLKGTHLPYDSSIESVHCLKILAEYCNQLKALGIYDKTTIIVVSDHGEHKEGPSSQPICLIKRAGDSSSSISFNASPVYFEDIIPTLAEVCGICGEGTANPYGTSIFSLTENMSRERTWYDRVRNDSYPPVFNTGRLSYAGIYNTYYAYEFIGTYDDLYQMTINNNVSYIYPMTEYFG